MRFVTSASQGTVQASCYHRNTGVFLTCLEQELSRRKLNPTRNQKELCKLPAITETPVFFKLV